jgi:hypothetical protein
VPAAESEGIPRWIIAAAVLAVVALVAFMLLR